MIGSAQSGMRRAVVLTAAVMWGHGALPAQENRDQPDVAFNASLGEHLVAWVKPITPTASEVVGRRFGPGGNATGSEFSIFSPIYGLSLTWAERVRLAPVQSGKTKWVAAMITGGSAYDSYPMLLAVDGENRASPAWLLGSIVTSVDVGGEETTVDDDVIVVVTTGWVRAYEVNPNGGGNLQSVRLDTTGGAAEVVIPPTGGPPGRYLVVWHRFGGDVFGAIVDRDLRILVPEFPIAQTPVPERNPEVDGDGTNWIVAYEQRNAAGDLDIACRGVTYDARSGKAVVSGPVLVQGQPGVPERNPTVVRTGESYQIGYQVFHSETAELMVESVEFLSCQSCEGTFPIASLPSSLDEDVRMAAGPEREGGLLVWQDANQSVRRLAFSTDDGDVQDLGGGCGGGGGAAATCAAVGASAFGIRVQHGEPLAQAWLLLGTGTANFACGSCTLVPLPVAALPAPLDENGNAAAVFALPANPSLRGQSFLAQWLVSAPGGCAAPGWSFSNALDVTIE